MFRYSVTVFLISLFLTGGKQEEALQKLWANIDGRRMDVCPQA